MAETFCSNPAGENPVPAKVSHQPEPSVAYCGSNPSCEAYTGSVQAASLSHEMKLNTEPTPFSERKAESLARNGKCEAVRRGPRAGHVHKGCPGTWEVSYSPF